MVAGCLWALLISVGWFGVCVVIGRFLKKKFNTEV